MAEIYLMHPKHGVKIATMEMEAQYDEMYGWVRFDPNDPAEPQDMPIDEEPLAMADDFIDALPEPGVEVNVMTEPRRRGRPRRV